MAHGRITFPGLGFDDVVQSYAIRVYKVLRKYGMSALDAKYAIETWAQTVRTGFAVATHPTIIAKSIAKFEGVATPWQPRKRLSSYGKRKRSYGRR